MKDYEMRAVYNFRKRTYDVLQISVPKGAREEIKNKAKEKGMSMNRYILQAVEKESGLKLTLDNALPWIKKED